MRQSNNAEKIINSTEAALRSACDTIVANAIDMGDGTRIGRISCDLLQLADYQRAENARHVANLYKAWNERLCDPIKVSYRDGIFWVRDGQHRLAVAKLKGAKDIKCIIHQGETYESDAEAFAIQDDNEKNVSVYSKLRAMALAGKSPYSDIIEICKNQSIPLVESRRPAPGECGCSSELLKSYRRIGREGFIWMLTTIRYVGWAQSEGGYSSSVIGALTSVFAKYSLADVDMLTERIARISVVGIKQYIAANR